MAQRSSIWDDVRIVEIPPPIRPVAICENCGSCKRTIIRTKPKGADGSIARECKCDGCHELFIELESPELSLVRYLPTVGRSSWTLR